MRLAEPRLCSDEAAFRMIAPQFPKMLHVALNTELEDRFVLEMCDYPFVYGDTHRAHAG